jgi:hypothetical protein
MEKYIDLFAKACDNHMRLEHERVQRERQLEIENLQAARVQCEQLRLALLEEAEPKKALCLVCNEHKSSWVSCTQGHVLCGDCFCMWVSTEVHDAERRLVFLRSREICCAWCKSEGNVFNFDMHKCAHFLSSVVWDEFLSAFTEYGAAEAEKSLKIREQSLQAQHQSLQLRLNAQKQQVNLTEQQLNALSYIKNNLIFTGQCPYHQRNTSNKCGGRFTSDFEGCAHIKVRFYRRVKPVSTTNRIPVPDLWQRRVRVVH